MDGITGIDVDFLRVWGVESFLFIAEMLRVIEKSSSISVLLLMVVRFEFSRAMAIFGVHSAIATSAATIFVDRIFIKPPRMSGSLDVETYYTHLILS